jgi:hypothetical protein
LIIIEFTSFFNLIIIEFTSLNLPPFLKSAAAYAVQTADHGGELLMMRRANGVPGGGWFY